MNTLKSYGKKGGMMKDILKNLTASGCQPKTFKTFILMVKPLKPLFFSEKPLFEMTNLYFQEKLFFR